MTLPGITTPPGTPIFLADGHSIDETGPFAQVQFAVGHTRARRVRTANERVVSVSWLLSAAQLAAVEEWFETTLQAGARQFAAQVARQDGSGLAWWTAAWVSFETELLHRGRGRVTGQLLLTGEPTQTEPNTSNLASEGVISLLCIPADPTVAAPLASEGTLSLTVA